MKRSRTTSRSKAAIPSTLAVFLPAYWPLPVAWDDHWPAIQAKNVKKLVLDGFTGKGFQGHPYAVELSNVEKVCVYRSELSNGEILKAE